MLRERPLAEGARKEPAVVFAPIEVEDEDTLESRLGEDNLGGPPMQRRVQPAGGEQSLQVLDALEVWSFAVLEHQR